MKNLVLTSLFVLLSFAVSCVSAGGNALAGKEKSAQKGCVACHGDDGNGTESQYPRLAGQFADYMVKALNDYQNGKRSNPIMVGMSANLSEQDIEDISAFYASQTDGLKDLSTQ